MIEEQYEVESDCEDFADYGPEGYHPVVLGEKFNNTYTVVQKLGWGHFSTVWLVQQTQQPRHVALKIQRSKDTHTESAVDELEMLTVIRQHEQDPNWREYLLAMEQQHPGRLKLALCRPLLLLDQFPHYGIHGKHMCSVFELMGPNLLDVIQHYEFRDKRMPLWLVKKITRQTLIGLVYLHEHCQIIHTDLKPQNIMVKMEPFEEESLVTQLTNYPIKPISMKYLKQLQSSKNSKNKKKHEKKKLKKKKAKEEAEGNPDKDNQEQGEEPSASSQLESESVPAQVSESEASSSNVAQPEEKPVKPEENKEQAGHQHQKKQKGQEGGDQAEDMSVLVWKSVRIKLNDELFFKIADMGNACRVDKHYTQDIQTREYRSPQVILGHEYEPNTDVFSLACTTFEMMTNNFLFKPKKISGIRKDEDHLFQMIETLGPMDKDFATGGKESAGFFNKKGKLLNGSPKEHVPLRLLLIEKYGYAPQEAAAAENFLLPMLVYEPKYRASAKQCLQHPWIWQ